MNNDTQNNEIKNKFSKDTTRLTKLQLSFFLVFILAIEVAIGYFGYVKYSEVIEQNQELSLGLLSIMVILFLYFASFIVQGKLTLLLRNTLVFLLGMVSISIIAIIKLDMLALKPYDATDLTYINAQIAKNEARINALEQQNSKLIKHINLRNREYDNEIANNRRAIDAQQRAIKTNAGQIHSGKEYQIIKNPF